MRGLGLRKGLVAAVKIDTLSLMPPRGRRTRLDGWPGLAASRHAADGVELLADHAGHDDVGVRDDLSRELAADAERHQGTDVTRLGWASSQAWRTMPVPADRP